MCTNSNEPTTSKEPTSTQSSSDVTGVVGYIRVEAFSPLEREWLDAWQTAMIDEFCDCRGVHEYYMDFDDEGRIENPLGRSGFLRMVTDFKAGEIDEVIFASTDRISGSPNIVDATIECLRDLGLRIRFVPGDTVYYDLVTSIKRGAQLVSLDDLVRDEELREEVASLRVPAQLTVVNSD